MNIITVCYRDDLANLYYQAKSLAKNWRGNKEWIIVPEDGDYTKQFILDKISQLMIGWNIIVPDPIRTPTQSGWWRQQICKLWSVDTLSKHEYSIILDAKNFLINPIDESWFFIDGKQKVRIFRVGPDILREPSESWKNCCKFFEGDPYQKLEGWNLTPWVWRKDLVQFVITEYAKKGHNIYNTISEMPAWEFNAYWFFAQERLQWIHADMGEGIFEPFNEQRGIKITGNDECFLPEYKKMPFWSFHRRMKNYPELVEFNNNFLKKFEIIDDKDIKIYTSLSQNEYTRNN